MLENVIQNRIMTPTDVSVKFSKICIQKRLYMKS